jgi:hypothetical protein
MKSGAEMGDDDVDETGTKIKKFNRNKENMHFENYASLPKSVHEKISEQLHEAARKWDGKDIENPDTALIHTGVVSIEAAIRQYVQKYAKTAKIKNVVDAFKHKVEESEYFEKIKHKIMADIAADTTVVKGLNEQMASIQNKIDNAEEAKKFKSKVDAAVENVKTRSQNEIRKIVEKYQVTIANYTGVLHESRTGGFWKTPKLELEINEARKEVEQFGKFAKKLELTFKSELDEIIKNGLINTSSALINEYKQKLASLTQELDVNVIVIEPLKLMGGYMALEELSIQDLTKTKTVQDGEIWIENTDKKWYKPWTWLQESGYFQPKHKYVEYIKLDELAQKFLAPIESGLSNNGDGAYKYAKSQSDRIAKHFKEEFERLDDIFNKKIADLKNVMTDRTLREESIKESTDKLEWLEGIKNEVESILEI